MANGGSASVRSLPILCFWVLICRWTREWLTYTASLWLRKLLSVQLQQVLMNLMLNAIEAMKDTGGN